MVRYPSANQYRTHCRRRPTSSFLDQSPEGRITFSFPEKRLKKQIAECFSWGITAEDQSIGPLVRDGEPPVILSSNEPDR